MTRNFQAQIVAASGSTLTPAASIGGGIPADPIPDNNAALKNTEIQAGSDLSIAKSRAPSGTILAGNQVTFTLIPRYSPRSPIWSTRCRRASAIARAARRSAAARSSPRSRATG
ncbi:hypothetical protein [Paracoccus sp. S3-43]|uniref:hypothetical protein n=1 Tax=Paracoccus sp. S3-43 TaxID=3030011 RepID=UPI0023AF189D|nr:hypothetical protein [Paracoccus sp. S3-43]WEF25171.1 hypothetical protein PXD02_04305 [Paracoccus sp. S3-43]